MRFDLGQKVKLVPSGEAGVIVGRAQYVNAGDAYHVRYVNRQGVQCEEWWSADALEPADP